MDEPSISSYAIPKRETSNDSATPVTRSEHRFVFIYTEPSFCCPIDYHFTDYQIDKVFTQFK